MSEFDSAQDLIKKYEISYENINRLGILKNFKVAFIFDDSGSMNYTLKESPLNKPDTLFKATRWNELQYFSKIAIDVCSLFNPTGCEVYFLHRHSNPIRNITKSSQILSYFNSSPYGGTPLTSCLKTLLSNNSPNSLGNKNLLVVIVTDGEPTDGVNNFKKVLESRGDKVFTSIVVCTEDKNSVAYLNNWDNSMPNLDVVDDYRNEKNEINKVKGFGYPFSYGDYVVKCLVGSIYSDLDKFDGY